MTRCNVFKLTTQDVPLLEILPAETIICLAPPIVKNFTSLSLPYLLNETKYLLSQITKQPGFSVENPVFIILEDCKNAWIASRMIEACFSRFNNDPKVWIIQGNFREFLDLSQFIAEGIDFAMCFEGDLQNEFSEYPLSIF